VDKDEGKQSIVEIARKRYQRARDAYDTLRQQAIADTRFVMGDSENNWQWPEDVYTSRAEVQKKPCLTINLTAQHCNQIINSIRQNRPSGRVLPVDNLADPDTAEILGGLCRSIQSYSNADTAHDIAAEHAIYGGEGYWRVLTEYETETSFDQVITIKPLVNPQLVYIDPDAIEPDRSDAKWGFIFEDLSPEEVKLEFPDLDPSSWAQDGDRGWVQKDMIRIAEYFYCDFVPDTLLLLGDGTTALKSKLPEGAKIAGKFLTLLDGQVFAIVNQRETKTKQWYWCKLVGGETEPVDKKEWPGSYLPIITVVGKELNVNGEMVRKGIVRDLKDPARMVNYSYSASVETLALQNKVPYLASSESIENFEDIWGAANLENRAYLPWNAYDEEGRQLPKPERQAPAVMPSAQVQMLQLSTEEMRAASGQQNANFGIKSEAASGVGIQRLKAQGEIATFHFPDNLARALTYEMRVLVDLVPKTYDTKRIVRILGLDGKESKVVLDPEMQQPYGEAQGDEAGEIEKIFNPLMGRYDVAISTGPSYQTQRQEAADTLTELTSRNPQIMQVAGDIVMRSYDFPMAEEMAKRLEKTLPPNLLDKKEGEEELPPQVQQQIEQMQQQMQQLDEVIQKMQPEIDKAEQEKNAAILKMQQAQSENMKLKLEIEKRDVIDEIEQARSDVVQVEQKQQAVTQPSNVIVDSSVAQTLVPIMQEFIGTFAESANNTGNAIAVLAEGQQAMMQQMANDNATTQAMLAEVAKPKQSSLRIVKQSDGSFVGEKVEL
jgi:hypothetical protein